MGPGTMLIQFMQRLPGSSGIHFKVVRFSMIVSERMPANIILTCQMLTSV